MRYEPHRPYVAPARGAAELWRTGAGVVLTFVAGLALYQLIFALASNLIGPEATQALVDRTSFDTDTPFATLYMLFAFGFFGIALAMVVHGLHHRAPGTLFGPWEAVVSDFLRVSLTLCALFLVLSFLLPSDHDLVGNDFLTRRAWAALLPLSLAAILIQAGTEELFFRGYLQQQLAARFPGTPAWMIGPALLFGLAHLSPGSAGANAPLYALWAFAFGLAAADLTARTGAIGAAIGFHFANNFLAILIVSLLGPGSGLALYRLPMQADDPRMAAMMLPELMTILVGWLAARLALKV